MRSFLGKTTVAQYGLNHREHSWRVEIVQCPQCFTITIDNPAHKLNIARLLFRGIRGPSGAHCALAPR